MPDPDKKPEDGTQTVEKLAEQVENLNKGIASERDAKQAAEKVAATKAAEADSFKAEVERLQKEVEQSKKGKEEPKVQLSPEDQAKLDSWAKENGFVKKEELEAEKGRIFNESLRNIESQAIDEFIRTHPEYNDEDKWAKVKAEFGQYKQPTSITAYRNILNKIHKELKGDDDATARARAAEENRKRLGLGGGSGGGQDADTTLESLREKYPNLSSELIEARLGEIKQLEDARKKRDAARAKK